MGDNDFDGQPEDVLDTQFERVPFGEEDPLRVALDESEIVEETVAVLEVDGEAVVVLEDVVVLETDIEPVAVKVDFIDIDTSWLVLPDFEIAVDLEAVLVDVIVLVMRLDCDT